MDWLINLSQKIKALLETDGFMATEEDAFDFVENQLQTVGNSIENQYQTVNANIENQLQRIRGNIRRYCSALKLGGVNYQLADAGNISCDSTAQRSSPSSPSSPNPFRVEENKLADMENEKIKPIAPKSPMFIPDVNSGKGLENSPISFDGSSLDGSAVEDSKVAEVENENIEPTDPESSMLCSEFNYVKGLGVSFSFLDESDSDGSFVSSDTVLGTDSSIPGIHSDEPRDQKYVQFAEQQPAPDTEALIGGLNLSGDATLDTADPDADWEII